MILSQIARIFDPHGFAAAFIVKAKIGMQHLWQKGEDWYEQLPVDEHNKWMELFAQMKDLNGVTIERGLTPPNAFGNPVLCVFSDASIEAFGTCAYSKWPLGGQHVWCYVYCSEIESSTFETAHNSMTGVAGSSIGYTSREIHRRRI